MKKTKDQLLDSTLRELGFDVNDKYIRVAK